MNSLLHSLAKKQTEKGVRRPLGRHIIIGPFLPLPRWGKKVCLACNAMEGMLRIVVDQMISPESSRCDLSDGARRSRNLDIGVIAQDQIPKTNLAKLLQWRSAMEVLLPDELDAGGEGEEAERAQEADDPPDARQPQRPPPLRELERHDRVARIEEINQKMRSICRRPPARCSTRRSTGGRPRASSPWRTPATRRPTRGQTDGDP